jgi:hypothetical protein
MQWVLLVCCPTPVLWYRLPVADFPPPGFQNCPYPTAVLHLLELSSLVPVCIVWSSPNNWLLLKLKLKLIYDQQSVGQSVLVSDARLEPATNFSFSLKFPSDSCGFIILWRPLWQENWSVIYCTIASGPCQSSHSWVKVLQNSWPYFTLSSETPPTWGTRFPYLYPPSQSQSQSQSQNKISLMVYRIIFCS